MKKILITSFLICFYLLTQAQVTWKNLGPSTGISTGSVDNICLRKDSKGQLFCAFPDQGNSGIVTVKRYQIETDSWLNIGGAVSTASGSNLSFHIYKDTLYTLYIESNTLYLKKFDGTNWVSLGTKVTGQSNYPSLVFDPLTDIPYVAFSNTSNGGYGYMVKYIKSSNSWINFSGTPFSGTSQANHISANWLGGQPVIVFSDLSVQGMLSAVKYDGSTWSFIGAQGFTTGKISAKSTILQVNPTTQNLEVLTNSGSLPYLYYYNGTSWNLLNQTGIINTTVSFQDFTFDKNGRRYISICEQGNSNKAAVFKSVASAGGDWKLIGSEGFTPAGVGSIDIEIVEDSIPVVAFMDAKVSNKANVMKYTDCITSVPTVTNSTVYYCQGAAPTALMATPANGYYLQWWGSNSVGGTPSTVAPIPSTTIIGTTSFFVSQYNGNCPTSRAKIDVIVMGKPTIPNITGPNITCVGINTAYSITNPNANSIYSWKVSNGTSFSSATPYTNIGIKFTQAANGINLKVVEKNAAGCQSDTAIFPINVLQQSNASFSYASSTFCQNITSGISPIITGTIGTFASSTNGLSLLGNTGTFTPNTSTAGTYIVTNTIPTNGGCPAATSTATITISPVPDATFGYPSQEICRTSPNPSPNYAIKAGVNYIFSSPSGLSINSNTGLINLANSPAGANTITLTASSPGCATATNQIGLKILDDVFSGFSYSKKHFCESAPAELPSFVPNGGPGVFSSNPGLTIESSTGKIDFSTSAPGTYIIKNQILAGSNTVSGSTSCSSNSSVDTITINHFNGVSFSYDRNIYCQNDTSGKKPAPQLIFTHGDNPIKGSFKALNTGVVVDDITGKIDLANTKNNSYYIAYQDSVCQKQILNSAGQIKIDSIADFTLAYSQKEFCTQNTLIQQPTSSILLGDIFNVDNVGLNLTTTNGQFNPSNASSGTYTITQTRTSSIYNSSTCKAKFSSTSIKISNPPLATFSYANSIVCPSIDSLYPNLTSTTSAGNFSSSSGLSLNPINGKISVKNSQPGNYIIKNYINDAVCGNVSATTSLRILDEPTATLSGNAKIYEGTNTNLNAVFTGVKPFKFSYTDGINTITISEIHTSTYTFNVSPSINTTYSITSVTDSLCAGKGNGNAVISVYPTLKATISNPASISVLSGDSIAINLSLTGIPTFSVVYSIGNIKDTISGINSSNYTFKVAATTTTAFKLLQISDASTSIPLTNEVITITVKGTNISQQPNNVVMCQQSTGAKFWVKSSLAATSFQWQKKAPLDASFSNIYNDNIFEGAFNDTLTIKQYIGTTEFRCIVNSNDTSKVATLTSPIVPTPTVNSPINYCAGANTNSLIAFTSNIKNSLLWWGTDTSLATSSTISTKPNNLITNKYYVSQKDSNGCDSKKAEILVNINALPTISHSGKDSAIVCLGSSASTKFAFTGTSPWTLNYSVNSSTVTLTNITTSPYTISITPLQEGNYTISVNNIKDGNGCTNNSNIKGVIIVEQPVKANFSYAGNPYCKTGSNPMPQYLTNSKAGQFTCLNADLKLNSSTGVIDLSNSQAGFYKVKNTIVSENSCPDDTNSSLVTIGNPPNANLKLVNSTDKSIVICKGKSIDMALSWEGQQPIKIRYFNGTTYKDSNITQNVVSNKIINASPSNTVTYKLISISDAICPDSIILTDTIRAIVKPTGDRTSIPVISQLGAYSCKNNTLKISVENDIAGAKYQWYRNGRLVIGDTLKEVSIYTFGEYSVNDATCFPSALVKIDSTVFGVKPKIESYDIGTDYASLKTDSVSHDTIQWYLNEYKIQGATSKQLEIGYNGTYKVNIKNGCNLFSNAIIIKDANYPDARKGLIFNADSSISFINNSLPYSIAPNPSNDFIHITGNDVNADYTITIRDLAGAILIQQSNNLLVNKEINIQTLASGLYLSEIRINNHSYFTKFVKQ